MSFPDWAKKLGWDVISISAEKEGIDPNLVAAIVWQESRGNRYAWRYEANYQWLFKPQDFASPLGCSLDTEIAGQKFSYGLAQLMGGTARDLGFKGHFGELFDAFTNLSYACKLLARLSKQYSRKNEKGIWLNTEAIISAYNAGSPRKTDKGKWVNEQYVRAVMGYRAELE